MYSDADCVNYSLPGMHPYCRYCWNEKGSELRESILLLQGIYYIYCHYYHFYRHLKEHTLLTSLPPQADTSNFKPSPNVDLIAGINVDDRLLSQIFQSVNSTVHLKDFYTVSLWNYCDGTITGGVSRTDFCSKPAAQYWFDPIQVWGLNNTATNAIPKNLQSALNTYKTVTKWMFIAYVVAFTATAVELLLGFLAIFSRWGSFVTTLVAGVSFPSLLTFY